MSLSKSFTEDTNIYKINFYKIKNSLIFKYASYETPGILYIYSFNKNDTTRRKCELPICLENGLINLINTFAEQILQEMDIKKKYPLEIKSLESSIKLRYIEDKLFQEFSELCELDNMNYFFTNKSKYSHAIYNIEFEFKD